MIIMANPPCDEGLILRRAQVKSKDKEVTIAFLKRGENADLRLPFHQIYPELDRLNEKYERNFKLITPHQAYAMIKYGCSSSFDSAPLATDAIVGFEKPGQAFGSQIAFLDRGTPRMVLPTWKYEGRADIALVVMGVSTKDFRKDGPDIFIDVSEDRLICVPDFPSQKGEYKTHPETTIPHGKPGLEHGELSELWRDGSHYVGAVAYQGFRTCVRLDLRPWDELAVAVSGAEKRSFLTAIGVSDHEVPELLSDATGELRDLSTFVKPSRIASLERLISSLEHKDK